MVRIRLRRTGKRGQPSYRVVVADSEAPRDGRFIENIGFYNPRTDPPTIEIKEDRARYWLSKGAQPSEPAERLLRKVGILPTLYADEATATPVVNEEPEAEAEPEAAPEVEVEVQEEAQVEEETESESISEA